MIAHLIGKITDKNLGNAVIQVNNIGYKVFMTADDINSLNTDEDAKIYIYEHIREQSHDLFGFISEESENLFNLLLGVNGVGPKMALSIMEIASAQRVKKSIAEGDTKTIQAANGVGKRLAERLVVDLKDKMGLISSDSATDFLHDVDSDDEATQGLIALGYSLVDAQKALRGVDKNLSSEQRVKKALQGSSK